MKKSIAITCTAVASLFISAAALSGQEVVFYYNDFTNNTGAGMPPEQAGWGYIYNSTENVATPGLLNNKVGNTGMVISQAEGGDEKNGFAHLYMQGFKQPTFMYSMDMDLISYTSITEISFDSGMSNLTSAERPFLALQIDDVWYVSDTRYGSSGSSSFSWVNVSVDPFEDTTWSLLEWELGTSPIGIGASAALPETGLLQAVGLWSNKLGESGENLRFDNITVKGIGVVVPEPSTYALIGGVVALAAAGLRRRKSK